MAALFTLGGRRDRLNIHESFHPTLAPLINKAITRGHIGIISHEAYSLLSKSLITSRPTTGTIKYPVIRAAQAKIDHAQEKKI
jgi:hypothetical protein